MLENSQSDALLIYDCCSAAERVLAGHYTANRGITDVIAACGSEDTTLFASKESFSHHLVEVLRSEARAFREDKERRRVTVWQIHKQILERMKNTRNQAQESTLIHIELIPGMNGRKIMLEPLERSKEARVGNERRLLKDRAALVLYFYLVVAGQALIYCRTLLKSLLKSPEEKRNIERLS